MADNIVEVFIGADLSHGKNKYVNKFVMRDSTTTLVVPNSIIADKLFLTKQAQWEHFDAFLLDSKEVQDIVARNITPIIVVYAWGEISARLVKEIFLDKPLSSRVLPIIVIDLQLVFDPYTLPAKIAKKLGAGKAPLASCKATKETWYLEQIVNTRKYNAEITELLNQIVINNDYVYREERGELYLDA